MFISEVSRNLGYTISMVHHLREKGHFPNAAKTGGNTSPWDIPESDVKAYVASLLPGAEDEVEKRKRIRREKAFSQLFHTLYSLRSTPIYQTTDDVRRAAMVKDAVDNFFSYYSNIEL